MLQKTVKRFIQKTHFWRSTGFDELSELYISNMLRGVALTIFFVFIPFYLYKAGYPSYEIMLFYSAFFAVRVFADIGAGYFVGRFGPKHAVIISNALQIVNALMLLSIDQYHWSVLLMAIPFGIAQSFFFVSYHVSFSKIKHTAKAGSELGHMQIFEKFGFMMGPLIGGVVGSVFGAQYIFIAASLLLLISLWPLFLTSEPVKIHQKLDFKTLPLHKIKRDLIANACLGVENTLSQNIWPFFVAVFVLSGAVYAQLGLLTAVGMLVAIISAKVIGGLADTRHARKLMRASLLANAGIHLLRPFVGSVPAVGAVNIANEVVTSGYRMPFMKGLYAAADDLPGHRIVYVVTFESMGSIVKATLWAMLALLATAVSLKAVLMTAFVVAAAASLGIMTERFRVYE